MKTLKEALFSKSVLDNQHTDPKFNSFLKLMKYNWDHPKKVEDIVFLYKFELDDYYSPILILNIENGRNIGLIKDFIKLFNYGDSFDADYLIANATAHAGFLCLKFWRAYGENYGFNLITFQDVKIDINDFKREYINVDDISNVKDGKVLFNLIKEKFDEIPSRSIV